MEQDKEILDKSKPYTRYSELSNACENTNPDSFQNHQGNMSEDNTSDSQDAFQQIEKQVQQNQTFEKNQKYEACSSEDGQEENQKYDIQYDPDIPADAVNSNVIVEEIDMNGIV